MRRLITGERRLPCWDHPRATTKRFVILRTNSPDGASYIDEDFEEDWPGEAALIEREMKRFREWAQQKIRSLLEVDGSIKGLNLVVFPHVKHYFVMRTENIRPALLARDGGRLVYSPEEGA